MKKKQLFYIVAALICNTLFLVSAAWGNGCSNNASAVQDILLASSANPTLTMMSEANANPVDDASRSGCCSHHQGVCGCSYGRAVCCDGSLSPSCGCN